MTIPVREVGGDYFDFMDSITDRLGLIVADVSGKGLAAALIMVSFRAYIHATVINELAMRIVMSRVNRLVYESTDGDRFITTFYGLIDPEHKRLLYINAGHNPPLLLHLDGSSELLKEGGVPLGVFLDSRYSESVVNLRSGDILITYTDGLVEASNSSEQDFGLEGLEKVARANSEKRAHEICQIVANAVREYSSGIGGLEDDLTISVIKVK
jgi:sigma-B regulation protein RsbU (phosphoserine phosphatase)